MKIQNNRKKANYINFRDFGLPKKVKIPANSIVDIVELTDLSQVANKWEFENKYFEVIPEKEVLEIVADKKMLEVVVAKKAPTTKVKNLFISPREKAKEEEINISKSEVELDKKATVNVVNIISSDPLEKIKEEVEKYKGKTINN